MRAVIPFLPSPLGTLCRGAAVCGAVVTIGTAGHWGWARGGCPPCPTSGHAPAPFWGAQGCVGLARQARGPRGGARQGTRSPSCRPGVSNEWYELPARPLIASSKTLNELLLRRAARARLVATAAVPAWHPSCPCPATSTRGQHQRSARPLEHGPHPWVPVPVGPGAVPFGVCWS